MKPYGSMRTHGAGTLRGDHQGQQVAVAGWVACRRDHGGVVFVDLRDASGVVQVVADPATLPQAHGLRDEYVIRVQGAVRARPEGMANPAIPTGDVEVPADSLEVLAASDTPPFPIADGIDTDEALRLHHRYLDLRRPEMAAAVRTRAQATSVIRRVMERHGFLDIETPLLTRSTPEGARDFLVPSRLQPRAFYALPQSPQIFKQLLMVAGFERYYQIARCFRDEDLRADRQPEFTQLDVEASFVDEEDVYALIEELIAELWRDVLGAELDTPFPRMTYAEAMRRFGSDKPDLRFGMELADLGEALAGTQVGVFSGALASGGSVLAVTLPQGSELTRRQFDEWVDFAKRRGAKGLAWAVVEGPPTPIQGQGAGGGDGLALRSPLAKFMTPAEQEAIVAATGASIGDAIFFGAGETRFTQELMGLVRLQLARQRGLVPAVGGLPARDGRWLFSWITHAPVVEWNAGEGRWDPVHHPFTAPDPEWADRLTEDPANATARAYDLTLNGLELGGGSIRIHDRDLQRRVFELIGITAQDAEQRFGFLLRGLSYGAPPHGGVAFGLDRLVMVLAGADSLRGVIPFPKTQSGGDPMTEAPAPVDDAQLADLGLRLLPPPAKA